MASEPYERPQLPSPARALNDRQRLIGAPDEVRSLGHLTVTEYGAAGWGPSPSVGRSVTRTSVELSWDEPDVMVNSAEGWAVGLTEEQVKTVMAVGGTHEQRAYLAAGYRQMNRPPDEGGTKRTPRYVHPTDAANPDAAGLITETLHEREVSAEEKKRRSRVPVPADAVSDSGYLEPVQFIEVEPNALHKVRAPDQYKKGRSGRMTLHRGRPLDDKTSRL